MGEAWSALALASALAPGERSSTENGQLCIDSQIHCMNLLIAIGAESTLRLRTANAKATFVSFMVQMCVFRVGLSGRQGCGKE